MIWNVQSFYFTVWCLVDPEYQFPEIITCNLKSSVQKEFSDFFFFLIRCQSLREKTGLCQMEIQCPDQERLFQ